MFSEAANEQPEISAGSGTNTGGGGGGLLGTISNSISNLVNMGTKLAPTALQMYQGINTVDQQTALRQQEIQMKQRELVNRSYPRGYGVVQSIPWGLMMLAGVVGLGAFMIIQRRK